MIFRNDMLAAKTYLGNHLIASQVKFYFPAIYSSAQQFMRENKSL